MFSQVCVSHSIHWGVVKGRCGEGGCGEGGCGEGGVW